MVCYKDVNLDPITDPSLKTIKWRDAPLSRAEQALVGVEFTDGRIAAMPRLSSQTAQTGCTQTPGSKTATARPGSSGTNLIVSSAGPPADFGVRHLHAVVAFTVHRLSRPGL